MRAKRSGDRMVPVNISFEPDLLERVDDEAERRDLGRSEFVREVLEFWFSRAAELAREQQPALLHQE